MEMIGRLALFVALGSLMAAPARAQPAGDMFRGKNVTVYIGFSPGGGYDVYARMVAHISASFYPAIPRSFRRTCPAPAA